MDLSSYVRPYQRTLKGSELGNIAGFRSFLEGLGHAVSAFTDEELGQAMHRAAYQEMAAQMNRHHKPGDAEVYYDEKEDRLRRRDPATGENLPSDNSAGFDDDEASR